MYYRSMQWVFQCAFSDTSIFLNYAHSSINAVLKNNLTKKTVFLRRKKPETKPRSIPSIRAIMANNKNVPMYVYSDDAIYREIIFEVEKKESFRIPRQLALATTERLFIHKHVLFGKLLSLHFIMPNITTAQLL